MRENFFMMVLRHFVFMSLVGFIANIVVLTVVRTAEASCGAVTCFVVVGSQQQVPQAGLLTFNTMYNYTPMRLLDGTNGVISAVDQENRRLIFDHHREVRTISQTMTFDLNYGITDRLGVQLTIPYLWRTHKHLDGLGEEGGGQGEPVPFRDSGIGDMIITGKYNVLPTLRSMIVAGFAVQVPTGSTSARDGESGLMESPTQLGRGNVGLIGSIYQTYELIPHRLNQFFYGSYRHTFRNNDGYQFGDEYNLNLGMSGQPLERAPWLVLTGQFQWRYLVHDNISASLERSATPADAPNFPGEAIVLDPNIVNRRAPNTGSTYFAFSPGFQVSLDGLINSPLTRMTSVYFYSQIPIMRDSNNNLAQEVSYIFGVTRSFQLTKSGL
jgi:hypothetical protein